MGVKEKAKRSAFSFFNRLETVTINFAMKLHYRWKLKRQYALKTDLISHQFKKEVLSYWRTYTNKIKPDWHKYYSSRNGIFDVRYVPDDLYYTVIDQHFNNRRHSFGVMNKNYFSLWFPEVKQPSVVIRKINGLFYDESYHLLSPKEALERCLPFKELIIKPAVGTGGGRGITFWHQTYGIESLKKNLLLDEHDYIVQELIIQHEQLQRIHSNSINSVRVITLLFKGKVHILSSVLRMGIDGNRVDNASAGGITCGIKEDGRLKDVAYSARGIRYDQHPQGAVFRDCVVPSFDRIQALVKKEQEKMANFKMISWDISVGEDGELILIEANLRLGEVGFHQLNNGPLFGDLTDEVLEEVFVRKCDSD